MKRVLFLSYNGLLEPILSSQAIPYLKGLSKKGYEFVLLTYEKERDLKRAGEAGVAGIKESLAKDGIDWHYLKYHKRPPLLSTLFDLFAGAIFSFRVVRSRGIKMVHVRGITLGMIMIALSKMLKVKVLFDMRGLLAEEYVGGGMWKEGGMPFRLVKRAEHKMFMIADAVTVLTDKHLELNRSLEDLAKRNIPMAVIPCCVDTSRFNYGDDRGDKERLGLKDKFVLMYPGKIGTFYLIDEMLGFFRYMAKVVPETVFFIVTNDDPAALIARAKALGVDTDTIIIKRNVPYEEMPYYMRMADAGIFFINPYKKIGSSPIKMGEFLASGVPVIINPGVGDTEELVRQNGVGVVVRNFTSIDYENAVDELLKLRAEGDGMRKRCREAAEKNLSLEDAVARYGRIYDKLFGA